MGKKGHTKSCFAKDKVIESYRITGGGKPSAPINAVEGNAPVDADPTKKKVMFQLRCEESAESGVLPMSKNTQEKSVPYSEVSSTETTPVSCEPAQATEKAGVIDDNMEDPHDLTRYGVYYRDGYNYAQHLRDPKDNTWTQETVDMYDISKPMAQGQSKRHNLRQQVIPEHKVSYQTEMIPFSELDPPDVAERKFDQFFDDAESDGELPDDIMMMLDGGEEDESEEDESDEDSEDEDDEFPEDVDDSKMPPLEGSDEFQGFEKHDDDCASNVSSGIMNVSDDEEGNGWLETPESSPDHSGARTVREEHTKNDSKLNHFFDAVALGLDPDLVNAEKAKCLPLMQSSREAKPATKDMDMINDKLMALMSREFNDSNLGGDPMEEVGGNLLEDAPQFVASLGKVKRMGNEIIMVQGPNSHRDGKVDAATRQSALQFCKNWKETKEELVEVTIPDPKAMKYNACNLPTIKNKNMPAIIRPELLFKKKKKKGITVKDLKQHDIEMNTPQRDVDAEAQTYKTMLTELSYRPLDESSDDRRERKTAVRELRKGRREEKKINILMHKEMLARTTSLNINAKKCKTISMI